MQSIVAFGALTIVGTVISWIPFINLLLGWVIGVVAFVVWIVMMVKAYQGITYKLPKAGDIAEKWVG